MTEFTLHRTADPSGVSGLGDVAFGVEFPDGAVAVRWPGDHPSTAAWGDIRDVEAIHGHEGSTLVTYLDKDRLVRAYGRVMPWLLSARYADRPITCAPHPDHTDRLRLTFKSKRTWAFWVALFDGSTDAATREEVAGEIQHQWIDPEGDLWLTYHSPIQNPGTAWERHDDPEVQP